MPFHFICTQSEKLGITLSKNRGGKFCFDHFLKMGFICGDAIQENGEVQGRKVFILWKENDPCFVALSPNACGDLQCVCRKNDFAVICSLGLGDRCFEAKFLYKEIECFDGSFDEFVWIAHLGSLLSAGKQGVVIIFVHGRALGFKRREALPCWVEVAKDQQVDGIFLAGGVDGLPV